MELELGLGAKAAIVLALALVGVFTIRRIRRHRESDEAPDEAAPAAAHVAASAAVADAELETLRRNAGNSDLRIHGDFHARGVVKLPSVVVIRGALVVEEGAELDGLAEVFGNVTLAARARVTRPLLVHGDMTLGPDARAPSCHVDGAVALGAGACFEGSLHCGVLYVEDSPPRPVAPQAPLAEPLPPART